MEQDSKGQRQRHVPLQPGGMIDRCQGGKIINMSSAVGQ